MDPQEEINRLRASNAELKRLLQECAMRLHTCAIVGGNAKYAVEGMVKTYLDPIGAPLPAWPSHAPEFGRGFEDD